MMNHLPVLRTILLGLAAVTASAAQAQPRAEACFYNADFETIDQFSGWDIGAFIETQTPEGMDLGELVPAWEIGDAQAANADGYFPVPDQPVDNDFVMTNDAAAPCNCSMMDVALTSPAFDFTDRTNVALECRVFNEGTLGAGTATIEGNFQNGSWIALATIPAVTSEWQTLFLNLSAFDGQQEVRIRFRWSDGGGWSSGFAMDDFCLRERLANDASISNVFVGDPAVSSFTSTVQSLSYRQLPLVQFDSLLFGMTVTNRGTSAMSLGTLGARLLWNGGLVETLSTTDPAELLPGASTTVQFATSWAPPEAGLLTIQGFIPPEILDDDPSDNSGTTQIQYTGPGWNGGYSAMSTDDGIAAGAFSSTENFVLANRMEIAQPGSSAAGVSVMLTSGSALGEEVRAILMDVNLSFLDTSVRHTITQQDLDNAWNGQPLYLPYSTQPMLSVGDHFAGVQHLKTGAEGVVEVALSNSAPVGGSILMEGITFDLTYLSSHPMVRLHLSEVAVGVNEGSLAMNAPLRVFPNPASDVVTLTVDMGRFTNLRGTLVDGVGRTVRVLDFGPRANGSGTVQVTVHDLPAGLYSVVVGDGALNWTARVQVVH